jgi:hypothetical protein
MQCVSWTEYRLYTHTSWTEYSLYTHTRSPVRMRVFRVNVVA